MQTQVQNEESVRLGSGILKVNDVNVGLIKGASIEVDNVVSEIKGDNGKLQPRQKINGVTFKATMLEIDLVNIQKIFGGELSTLEAASNTETGNDRKIITYDDVIRTLTMYPVEFINTNGDGEVFGIKIFQAYAKNGLTLPFGSDEALDSSMEIPVEFGVYPDENNKYFEVIDEQAITVA